LLYPIGRFFACVAKLRFEHVRAFAEALSNRVSAMAYIGFHTIAKIASPVILIVGYLESACDRCANSQAKPDFVPRGKSNYSVTRAALGLAN
jgi:hypothetical protein